MEKITQQALTARTRRGHKQWETIMEESKRTGADPTQAVVLQLERHRKERKCKWSTIFSNVGVGMGCHEQTRDCAIVASKRLQENCRQTSENRRCRRTNHIESRASFRGMARTIAGEDDINGNILGANVAHCGKAFRCGKDTHSGAQKQKFLSHFSAV